MRLHTLEVIPGLFMLYPFFTIYIIHQRCWLRWLQPMWAGTLAQLRPGSSIWERLLQGSTFSLQTTCPSYYARWESELQRCCFCSSCYQTDVGIDFRVSLLEHCQILFTREKSNLQFTDAVTYVSCFRLEWLIYNLWRSDFFLIEISNSYRLHLGVADSCLVLPCTVFWRKTGLKPRESIFWLPMLGKKRVKESLKMLRNSDSWVTWSQESFLCSRPPSGELQSTHSERNGCVTEQSGNKAHSFWTWISLMRKSF